ncbi:HLH-domain-containing protein [Auricularia subglabra TFB-10046 SS5]|nr:HLH-domain-containing protein [Auricularia subglabra TFB-10046 SS5]
MRARPLDAPVLSRFPPWQNANAFRRAQLASEKRRRRRESHNAVERRRRDNINEKISELATLIPEIMLDPTAGSTPSVGQALFAVSNGSGGSPGAGDEDGDDGGKDAGPMKANKGMILKKSVEYIRYLQQLVTAQANRNSELESQLTQYRNGQTPAPGSGQSQSAEEMQMLLASPGVMATMYEEPPESARASTESDEDMRPGTGAEEERGRGRAVQRLGVAVKTEDIAMES